MIMRLMVIGIAHLAKRPLPDLLQNFVSVRGTREKKMIMRLMVIGLDHLAERPSRSPSTHCICEGRTKRIEGGKVMTRTEKN